MEIWAVKHKNSFFSDLISNVTHEKASHIAVRLDNGFVCHADFLSGVHYESERHFLRRYQVVEKIEPKGHIPDDFAMDIIANFEGQRYDVGAFLFLGFSLILRTYLNIPLPKSNLWQASNMFICTEFGLSAAKITNDAMLTPVKMIKKLVSIGNWVYV